MKSIFVTVALLLLSSIGSGAADSPTSSAPHKTPWISREITGGGLSLGPNYSVTIFADGLVIFDGIAHVKQKGQLTKRLSRAAVAPIFSKLAALDVTHLADDYSIRKTGDVVALPPSDTSWVNLSFLTEDGKSKLITGLRYAPAELKELSELVRTTAAVEDWTGISEEPKKPAAK